MFHQLIALATLGLLEDFRQPVDPGPRRQVRSLPNPKRDKKQAKVKRRNKIAKASRKRNRR